MTNGYLCYLELEEARLENRKLLSFIDRLKETELSLRSQVEKVCAAEMGGAGVLLQDVCTTRWVVKLSLQQCYLQLVDSESQAVIAVILKHENLICR